MPCCLVLWPFFFSWIRLVFPYLCALHAVFSGWSVILCPFSTSKSHPARNVYITIRLSLFLFNSLYLSQCTYVRSVVSDSLWTPATHPPPVDCSPPGSFVHGVLQARILKWVAIRFSRGSCQPRDWTCVWPLPQWQLDSLPLHHLGTPHLPEACVQNHLFILWGPLALLSVGHFRGSNPIWPWVIVIYTHFLVISLIEYGACNVWFFFFSFHSVSTQCSLAKYQKQPHFWGGVGIFVLCQLNFSIA